MSFLFPLYLAAGLAVGLPILFHLIRQTPKGRQVFSSTMFLSPSPPRVTKRSRIEDWLLLLLRGCALLLLACAFARPFLRAQELEPDTARTGTRYLVLLDLSASMRRESCWPEARRQLAKVDQCHIRDIVGPGRSLRYRGAWAGRRRCHVRGLLREHDDRRCDRHREHDHRQEQFART